MKFAIDRYEGDFAVLESKEGEITRVPKNVIPQNAVEGDIISIEIDSNETRNRQKSIRNKMEQLFKD